MQLWTRQVGHETWRQWDEPLCALASLSEADEAELFLLCEGAGTEPASIDALRRLQSCQTTSAVRVTVGCRTPSREWIAQLHSLGFSRVLVGALAHPGAAAALSGPFCRPEAVCPRLHTRLRGAAPQSVCGAHGDRMVLGRPWLGRHCLTDWRTCPELGRGHGG